MNMPVSASRRQFLKLSSGAAGLTLGISLLPVSRPGFAAEDTSESLSPNVFVSLDNKGTITITCHRSEMGQQVRTSIPQIVADELDADWSRINIEQAQGDPKYGDQNTDGSRSIRRNFDRLRIAGATAAYMLRQAAAQAWNVDIDDCMCDNHTVVHTPSGNRVDYAELVPVAATLTLPQEDVVQPKPRSRWKYIGKGVASVDLDKVVSGNTVFGQDVQLEGMLVAVIQRPPVLYSFPEKVDDTKARAIKGVVDVITMPKASAPAMFNPLGGVAVVARNTWAAMQGVQALDITWAKSEHSDYDSQKQKADLIATAEKDGEVVRERGDAIKALESAEHTLRATYYAPHLAQAPMEPPAATAWVHDDGAEIWACTQTPQSTQQNVAGALKLPSEKVAVNVTLLGGGFGRKSKPDFSVEAALLSKQMKAPVKVVWRREDDIQHGYYHSVSAQHIQAAYDDNGKTTAWRHNTVFPSISSTFNASVDRPSSGELDLGFIDNPFLIDNMRLERGIAHNHVRIGWMRSVSNIYHAFAIQSFADELAHATGKDSKQNLLELIGAPRKIDLTQDKAEYANYGDPQETYPIDTGRLRNVIERVTRMADWDKRGEQGRFLGLAAHRSFLTYVATVIEVTVDDQGSWKTTKAWISIDAGTVVNPEHVRAQCEGGLIYGISCAIGEISAQDGAVTESNFHNYQVARIQHTPPDIEVDIVESKAPPAGVGEPPTPPTAPALANALFAATGKRIRQLPIPLTIKA